MSTLFTPEERRAVIDDVINLLVTKPQAYQFMNITVPEKVYESGCLLGWAGYFARQRFGNRLESGARLSFIARVIFRVTADEFYDRLTGLVGSEAWTNDASLAASTLRKIVWDDPELSWELDDTVINPA